MKRSLKLRNKILFFFFCRSGNINIEFACQRLPGPWPSHEPDAAVSGLEDVSRPAQKNANGHRAHTYAWWSRLYRKAASWMANLRSRCNDRNVVQPFGWNAARGCCKRALRVRQTICTARRNACVDWRMQHPFCKGRICQMVEQWFRYRGWVIEDWLGWVKKYRQLRNYMRRNNPPISSHYMPFYSEIPNLDPPISFTKVPHFDPNFLAVLLQSYFWIWWMNYKKYWKIFSGFQLIKSDSELKLTLGWKTNYEEMSLVLDVKNELWVGIPRIWCGKQVVPRIWCFILVSLKILMQLQYF